MYVEINGPKEFLCIFKHYANARCSLIFVPTPLEGGEELYTQLGFFFFVQSILADRYIHRREMRLVSLESLSSVECGIKKIFLIFVFDREISGFKLSRK